MYVEATGCPFPVYADPTRKLYSELGMIKTLALGEKPAYAKKSILSSSLASIAQGLKQIKTGLVTKAGDSRQVGGEFLFEPTSIMTPTDEVDRQMDRSTHNVSTWSKQQLNGTGDTSSIPVVDGSPVPSGPASRDGQESDEDPGMVEDKELTWCHRMTNTRDHAEIPELMEILGLDGEGKPSKDPKTWKRAMVERKGTGTTQLAKRMSSMKSTGHTEAGGS